MSAKRKAYNPKSFESKGGTYLDSDNKLKKDTSANIYESMLTSEVFRELKTRQKILYVYCKAQLYGKRKPGKDYKDNPEYQREECIYMNWDIARRNKLYSDKDSSTFYKDMKVLAEKGFIEKIKSGKAHKEKNIYLLSSKWHTL